MLELMSRFYIILQALWRQRYLIVLPALLMPLAGVFVAKHAPKYYQSHTSLLVQETAKLNPFLEDLAVSANLDARMEALTTLLHSRHILTEVAIEQGLLAPTDSPERLDEVIGRLSSALTVRKVGKDLIRIDYRADNPQGMAELLGSVTNHFVEQLLAPERSSIQESQRFLYQHLLDSSDELHKAEQALADFRSLNADSLPELHSANAQRLGQLRQQLIERQAELAGAERSLGSIDQQLSRTNPLLLQIEQQIVQNQAELATLLARYTEGHSSVLAVRRTLRRLESERQQALAGMDISEAGTLVNAVERQLSTSESKGEMLVIQAEALMEARQRVEQLREEVRQLQHLEDQLVQQVTQLGSQEQQLLVLSRDLKVKRRLYEDLLTRYEMAQVTGALGLFEQGERIKIIDKPYTPSTPLGFPGWVFVIAGFVGGLGLGLGLCLLAELSNPTLRSAADLEALTGLPVITRIPPLN
ncbi:Wzz/FepE/Etk N-terminal domain-containing protein [Aliagarivorans marinus]|uniref:Wzz/FepE/Etk N-terminal domain-containing protein n=1 Tax=Aliagarivorans marinus TaxID=561965 RepID=UPI0004172A0F|nr:Wzz/FepE/Etk N-terminal domain-containing protein [Aliagarivorans marinus]